MQCRDVLKVKIEGVTSLNFKTYYKAMVIKATWYW